MPTDASVGKSRTVTDGGLLNRKFYQYNFRLGEPPFFVGLLEPGKQGWLTMSRLRELQEKRLALAGQIRELGNRAGDEGFSGEDQAAWENVNADYNSVCDEMARVRAGEEVKGRLAELDAHDKQVVNAPAPGRSERLAREHDPLAGFNQRQRSDLAFNGWCRAQGGVRPTQLEQAALAQFSLEGNERDLEIKSPVTSQYRDIQSHFHTGHQSLGRQKYLAATMTTTGGSGADGGKSIPAETFLQRLTVNMLAFGPMWQTSEVIVTDHGNTLVWPTVDDTAQSAAIVTEGSSVDSSGSGGTNPTFAQRTWSAYKYGSGTALVTQELLEDSAFDLSGVLADLLGERIGRGTNAAFTTGTGSSQPTGIAASATTTGVTCASATAITANELIQLVHSIDPAYRGQGRTGWMMHDNTILAIRQLKDSYGQYMWQPGLQNGLPDRLLGFPVWANQAMDSSLATTDVAIVFGDLSAYKIRQVRQIRFYRLDELYRASDKTGFVALVRADGKLLTAGTAQVKKMIMA